MASIIPKKVKNNTYYYYVESKRINGKPRIVNQKYLGSADSVLEKMVEAKKMKKPLHSVIYQFADVMLLYEIASKLGAVRIIDKYAMKRNQGASIGEYALIAAINRAISPTSKNSMASWYSKTFLSQILPITERMLTPQNYWNHMKITDETINHIEDEFVKTIIEQYDVDTSHLIYDATNFYTYIDTMQNSNLAKRGHCKSKRNDLKIVGLSMMITPDCNIPLLYDTYPGNLPDSKQFAVMLNKLKTRYETLTLRKAAITIAFDRGNNSQTIIDLLESEQFPLYYVGGLKRNQCTVLYSYDTSCFIPLKGKCFEGTTAFRTTMNVYERDMTIVVSYNQNLFDGQMQGIQNNIEKTTGNLVDLQTRLRNRAEGIVTKGRCPTAASVEKQIKTFLSVEFMDDIFEYDLTTYNGIPYFSYSLNTDKLASLKSTILGKTVLFTNRHEWTNEEIVGTYRSAWHIEHTFRQMKDNDHLAVRPLFHWTDQKIKVHIFYCVLGYRLCCLLKKELLKVGINDSVNKILDELSEIQYVVTVFGTSKSDIVSSFSQGVSLAESIVASYDLKNKYLPFAC